jgi:5-methylcytosine-specific restriction endonuclease McrBC regulatory subunit McrC
MWCNGRKFRIKQLDETRKTYDSGINAVFQVTNVSSRSDIHPRESKNIYYRYLNDILECDFNSFKLVLFDVKWYRLQMHERDEERTIIQHANGFQMIKTMMFERGHDLYVFPSQCE